MSIVRIEDKTAIADIENLDTTPLSSYAYRVAGLAQRFEAILVGWMGSSKITRGEGAPNVKMRGYESTPGVWLYLDEETGVRFAVFSDGWKKKPWKGSSIELVLGAASSVEVTGAIERLAKHLMASSQYYGFLDPDKLQAWATQDDTCAPGAAADFTP